MPDPHSLARILANRGSNLLSRRASLIGLLGAALTAAVVDPAPAHAGKAGKKARKACRRQVGQCETSVTTFCSDFPALDPEECEAAFRPCCASFQNCAAGKVQKCWVDALEIIEL